jgi:hypothetical protein
MKMSQPQFVITQRRGGRRIDLFSAVLLFVIFALPLSVLYQVSVHYLGDNPAVAVTDLLRINDPRP